VIRLEHLVDAVKDRPEPQREAAKDDQQRKDPGHREPEVGFEPTHSALQEQCSTS
jgi:hypothetical protein